MGQAKIILLRFFACCLLVIIADQLVGVIMRYAVKNTKNGFIHNTRYILTQSNPSIAVFGSSRATFHYNTALMQKSIGIKAINCGCQETNIVYYYIALKTLLKYHTPQIVIVDVKVDEFNDEPNADKLSLLYPLAGQIALNDTELNAISPYENYKLLFNTYRYNNQFLELLKSLRGQADDTAQVSGFHALHSDYDIPPPDTLTYSHFSLPAFAFLKKIIEECTRRNIRLIVCVSPTYGYVSYSRSLIETEKICQENNIQFLNYTNNNFLPFDRSFFSDRFHLNGAGADRFTSDLIDRIK